MALRALDTNGYAELLRSGRRSAGIRAAFGGAGTDLVVLMCVMAELQQGCAVDGRGPRPCGPVPRPRSRRPCFLDVHVAQVCLSRGIVLWTDDAGHDRIWVYVGHRIEPLPR